ncbi:MAG TPA: efflux RND transporter periplasmic adaptor subunit [Clostridia bacterium]|nr:efflux RND transporter periplasmic adaptor subunit [Clostridia bacterium]
MKINRIISGAVLLTLIVASLSACGGNNQEITEGEQETSIPVVVSKAMKGNISQDVVISGQLKAENEISIIPKIAGVADILSLNVELGDYVEKGDLLFTLDNGTLSSSIKDSLLAYETAKNNFERISKLYEEGAVSRQQYEQARLSVSDTQIKALQNQMSDSYVKAPISGIVSALNVEKNGFAVSGQPSAVITDISVLQIEADITEKLINKVFVGKNVQLMIPAISNEKLDAKVSLVNPVPNALTNLYKMKIQVVNYDDLIKPGMIAQIYFSIDESKNVLMLPIDAVIQEGNEYFVYIVEEGKAVRKTVKVDVDNGEYIEIVSGVKADDDVIVSGQEFVKDMASVRIIRGE